MAKIIWVDFSKKEQQQRFESARERLVNHLKEDLKERVRQKLRERMKREERARKIIPFPKND